MNFGRQGIRKDPIKTNFCPKTIEDDRTVGDQYELLRPRIELLAIDMKGIELWPADQNQLSPQRIKLPTIMIKMKIFREWRMIEFLTIKMNFCRQGSHCCPRKWTFDGTGRIVGDQNELLPPRIEVLAIAMNFARQWSICWRSIIECLNQQLFLSKYYPQKHSPPPFQSYWCSLSFQHTPEAQTWGPQEFVQEGIRRSFKKTPLGEGTARVC